MESPSKKEVKMSKELYEAALCGDFEYFENTVSDEYLCRKTLRSNNIVHLAIRYGNIYFMGKVLDRFPELLWEPNKDGNTPFHILVEIKFEEIVREVCNKLEDRTLLSKKNLMGNTPLHWAIIHSRVEVAIILLEKDPSLASTVNLHEESPLHLAIKHFPDDDDDWSDEKKQNCLSHVEKKKTNWGSDEFFFIEEKFVILIVALLEKGSEVAGWRDGSGLTPLHQAASLNTAVNLNLIGCMIEYYPQCMEECDTSGKTILHHLINRIIVKKAYAKDFLRKTRIHRLINHQDNEGNTPSHLAFKHLDFIMVELINAEMNGNWLLKNKEGVSVNFAAFHQSDMLQIVKGKAPMKMTEESCRIIERGDLFTIKEHAEMIGLRFFRSLDSKGRNVIHKLLLLIKSGCVIIPDLFINCMTSTHGPLSHEELYKQSDNEGDTPAHVLAQLNPDEIMIHRATGKTNKPNNPQDLYPGPPKQKGVEFFTTPYINYTFAWENLGETTFFEDLVEICLNTFQQQWLQKNKKGNTSLHEAILSNNYPAFKRLTQHNIELVTIVNKKNQTVLHLLATKKATTPSIVDEALVNILKNSSNVDYNFHDNDGLTPITRAIEARNLEFAERLWKLMSDHSPKLKEIKDKNGQTFWHLLAKLSTASFDSSHSFFTNKDVCSQLQIKDNGENTALHLALKCRNFDVAQFFLKAYQKHNFDKSLLDIRNNKGDTPGEMIGALPYLTQEFEKFIWKDSKMIGTRSIWGIPTKQMKGYVNTMGIIAALLTTITFTAAFTVPGGPDQENGNPLLIQDLAFQVFIVSDVFAMCFSMMNLFCLLWIMASGEKSNSVVLLDFSIIWLLASFYTTLLTFMTGLYATLHHVKPWIAIVSLIPCSILAVMMQRWVIINFIIPSWRSILELFYKVYHFAKDSFSIKNLLKYVCHPKPKPRPELPISSDE